MLAQGLVCLSALEGVDFSWEEYHARLSLRK